KKGKGKLGQGSYGSVFKVKNRLDKQTYAVKVIQMRNAVEGSKRREKVMREIRTLSLMAHENVVRYYQCWVENVDVNAEVAKMMRDDEEEEDVEQEKEKNQKELDKQKKRKDENESSNWDTAIS
ncbi:MAG: hypothetical protein EZS28_047656, partial [Streblomastix strix]